MVRRPSTQTASLVCELWAGMPVFDANGDLVGTVKYVHVLALDAKPTDIGAHLADRPSHSLLRVTGAGLMDNDCLVRAEQIASADDERVLLSVTATDLSTEYGHWI